MLNKQRIILISIFAVTFVIGLTAILVSNIISSPKSTTTTTTTNTSTIPSLSPTLYCTSTANNKSLTLTWNVPANINPSYTVNGQVSDFSTQAQPIKFGPIPVSQGSYQFDQANGLDKYFVTVWVQDANGNKGSLTTSNQIDSSQCISGSQPTPPAAISATATPTPTTATKATATATPTPTATVQTLACNNFSLTQNGNALASNTVSAGSSAVTITSGITSPSSATLSYTSAQWSINPTTPALNVSNDGTSATWTPPTSTSNGLSYVVTLSGVTDASNATLSSPCTVTITLGSASLPNTAGTNPTLITLIAGAISTLIGAYLIFKREERY